MEILDYIKQGYNNFYEMLISEENPYGIRCAILEYQLNAPENVGFPIKAKHLFWKVKENKLYREYGIREKIDMANHAAVINTSSNKAILKDAIYSCLSEAIAKAPWLFSWKGKGLVIFFINQTLLNNLSKTNKKEIKGIVKALLNYEGDLDNDLDVQFTSNFGESTASLNITKLFSYYENISLIQEDLIDNEDEDDNSTLLNNMEIYDRLNVTSNFMKMLKAESKLSIRDYKIIGNKSKLDEIVCANKSRYGYVSRIKKIMSKESTNYISSGCDEGPDCILEAFKSAILNLPIRPNNIKKIWVQVWLASTIPMLEQEFESLKKFISKFPKNIVTHTEWSTKSSLDGQQAEVAIIAVEKDN